MDLTERREEIIAEHQAQERYDPHWKAEADRGRKISERPIAFLCDDEVVVVGPCVGKIRDGLAAFFEKIGADRDALAARLSGEPAFAQAAEKCRKALQEP